MRAHDTCTHAQTAKARRTCREVRKYARAAEELGLQAQEVPGDDVTQLIIWNARDLNGTKVVWTRLYDHGGYDFFIISKTGQPRRYRGSRNLRAWLNVLARAA